MVKFFPWITVVGWKFEAKAIAPSKEVPHGIKYSLTLHDRMNSRVVGFDNAHAVKLKKQKGFSGRKITWDHLHRLEKIESYTFKSAGQLLEDFWKAVDEYFEG